MSLRSQLQSILDDVHGRFTYISDKYQFNKVEHWMEPESLAGEFEGDCDDFALACRKMCRKAGIQSRLIHCTTESGEGHLVLSVDGWILDNRSTWVNPRQEVDYIWYKASGLEAGDKWHKING